MALPEKKKPKKMEETSLEESVCLIQDQSILELNRELLKKLEKADPVAISKTVLDIFRDSMKKIKTEIEEKSKEKNEKERVLETVFKEKIKIKDMKADVVSFKEYKKKIFNVICEKYVVLKYNPKILLFSNTYKLKFLGENKKQPDFVLQDMKSNKFFLIEFLNIGQTGEKIKTLYQLLSQSLNRKYTDNSRKELGKTYFQGIFAIYIINNEPNNDFLGSLSLISNKAFLFKNHCFEELSKENIKELKEFPWKFSDEELKSFSEVLFDSEISKILPGNQSKAIKKLSHKSESTKNLYEKPLGQITEIKASQKKIDNPLTKAKTNSFDEQKKRSSTTTPKSLIRTSLSNFKPQQTSSNFTSTVKG
jgi:hypothetical protein